MPEITLEAVAERLAALERQVAALTAASTTPNPTGVLPAVRDWRSVVGISDETEFSRLMQAEIEANSEAERKAAREAAE